MCFKSSRPDRDERRQQRDEPRQAERQRPSDNPRPRGNGEMDRQDVERSLEKMTALVGR
jgi:hypothetical protein